MRFLFCQNCNKKLLQVDCFDNIAIKCNRCKQINHFSCVAQSPKSVATQ
ncbi:Mu-like prophage protein Com [Moraxella caprae]|uniref:Mu-like prophage protein Com n=1 Tax=Moraxella caprae TaxID=90240 RepID=A0A378R068_9GAMM|nr:Mu-like prophage protein Com [Moraxella caprae]